MLEGNLEKTREGFEELRRAFETRDFDAYVEEYIDPEVEWVPFNALPDSSGYHGREGVKQRLAELIEPFESPRFEVEEILDDGSDRQVVQLRMSGQGKASGADVDVRFYQVLKLRAGFVVRVEWYTDRTEALEAAGLVPPTASG